MLLKEDADSASGDFHAEAEYRRSAHQCSRGGAWKAAEHGRGPTILTEQARSRVPEPEPMCCACVSVSPFNLPRGAAALMAMDPAASPDSEVPVQLCGDAQLSNFGLLAGPERLLVCDINDFEGTPPRPWEWDPRRLAARLEVAGS